jgi:hypothetical protein
MKIMRNVTFKVEKNVKFGDFRVNMYINGIWENQLDGGWSKYKAEKVAKRYREMC